MKASLRIIGAALIVLSTFAGMASAETPDACGDWNCAKLFNVPNNDYTNVDGILTKSPADNVDKWKSTDPNVGDTLLVYLDGQSYENGLAAQLYDGNLALMQQVKKDNNVEYDRTLNAKPTFVNVSGFPNDYSYTFVLSRNV